MSKTPLSERLRSLRITLDVTVDPDETSDVEDNGRPDQNHWTLGLGRPGRRKSKIQFYKIRMKSEPSFSFSKSGLRSKINFMRAF